MDTLNWLIDDARANKNNSGEGIRINDRKGLSCVVKNAKHFNNGLNEFINGNDKFTNPECQIAVMNCFNMIYLDGDYSFNLPQFDSTMPNTGIVTQIDPETGEEIHTTVVLPTEDYDKVNTDLANEYTDRWVKKLAPYGVSRTMVFIPFTKDGKRGGFHAYIFTEREVNKQDRDIFYEEIRTEMKIPFEHYVNKLSGANKDNAWNTIFDKGPLAGSNTMIIPYAQKSVTSRKYLMISDTTGVINLIATKHTVTADITLPDDLPLELAADYEKAFTSDTHTSEFNIKFFGPAARTPIEFIQSLEYTCDHCCIWSQLADNDVKVKKLLPMFCNTFWLLDTYKDTRPFTQRLTEFANQITLLLLPLLMRTVVNDDNTKRATYSSLHTHVMNSCLRYTHIDHIQKLSTEIMQLNNAIACEKVLAAKEILKGELAIAKSYYNNLCYGIISTFVNFTKDVITTFTNELEPWNNDKVRDGSISYARAFPRINDMSKDFVKSIIHKDGVRLNYYNVITTWMKWIICFNYRNKTVIETAAMCIFPLLQYNLAILNDGSTIIYNVLQDKTLFKYPYNQWIRDCDDDSILLTIVNSLFNTFIDPLLQSEDQAKYVLPYLDQLQTFGYYPGKGGNLYKSGVSLSVTLVFQNILGKLKSLLLSKKDSENIIPLNATQDPYFPMKNGILEFVIKGADKGKYIFHSENRGIYHPCTTHTKWTEGYNFDCPEYKMIKTMMEQTHPAKESRDYILRMKACAMTGMNQCQNVLFLYGSGSDGKSIPDYGYHAMLGDSAICNEVVDWVNGKEVTLISLNGLASNMKAAALLEKDVSTSGHSEGGTINMYNKRFITVQEPDLSASNASYNMNTIKELCSGSSISARRIYKEAVSFTPNALICIQSNTPPKFNDNTIGTSRRVRAYSHISKFYNEDQLKRCTNNKNVYPCNSMLGSELATNPKVWEAYFQYMLPFAVDFVKMFNRDTAGIPQPPSVMMFSDKCFNQATGLGSWLNTNIVDSPHAFMRVNDLVNIILKLDNAERIRTRTGILSGSQTIPVIQARDITRQTIINNFGGECVCLMKEQYVDRSTEKINSPVAGLTIEGVTAYKMAYAKYMAQQKLTEHKRQEANRNYLMSIDDNFVSNDNYMEVDVDETPLTFVEDYLETETIHDSQFARLFTCNDVFIVGKKLLEVNPEIERDIANLK